MKKVIRRGCFETNSSSSHSISFSNDNICEDFNIKLDEDGYIYVDNFGEYGWGCGDVLTSQEEKLNYLLTMATCFCHKGVDNENFDTEQFYRDSEYFKRIEDIILRYCNGIKFSDNCFSVYSCDNRNFSTKFNGYVDHQSVEKYDNIAEIIFNPTCVIEITNDNF